MRISDWSSDVCSSDLIAITDPDVITLDIKMPDMDGLQLLDRIMARKRRPVIMLSSLTVLGGRVQAECMTRGAAACFNKSHIICEAPQLIRLIHRVASGKQNGSASCRERVCQYV